jgi:hypothetical protein
MVKHDHLPVLNSRLLNAGGAARDRMARFKNYNNYQWRSVAFSNLEGGGILKILAIEYIHRERQLCKFQLKINEVKEQKRKEL